MEIATLCEIVRSLSMISLLVSMALAVELGGCDHGSASTSDEMAERWYRYGQHIGSMIGNQTGSDEELGMVVGSYLLGDTSPEATLLMASGMLASEHANALFKKRLYQGVRHPKDTSSELFLDALPESERAEYGEFSRLYAGKNFVAPEAKQVIHAKLRSGSFAVRALYAKLLIGRYVAGQEDKVAVLVDLDRQLSLESPKRENKFWNLLKEFVDSHKPTHKIPKLTDRELCRENLQTLSNAEMAYRIVYKTDVFTTDLTKLVKVMEKDLPVCPERGSYSVALVPTPAFTVHCSIGAHDEGAAGEPAGYSPGLNSR